MAFFGSHCMLIFILNFHGRMKSRKPTRGTSGGTTSWLWSLRGQEGEGGGEEEGVEQQQFRMPQRKRILLILMEIGTGTLGVWKITKSGWLKNMRKSKNRKKAVRRVPKNERRRPPQPKKLQRKRRKNLRRMRMPRRQRRNRWLQRRRWQKRRRQWQQEQRFRKERKERTQMRPPARLLNPIPRWWNASRNTSICSGKRRGCMRRCPRPGKIRCWCTWRPALHTTAGWTSIGGTRHVDALRSLSAMT